MKAITLTQPWASLVALGEKQIETRSWQTSYRGPIAIHAAKGFPKWAKDMAGQNPYLCSLFDCDKFMALGFPQEAWKHLPTGSVIAVADLTAIYSTNSTITLFAATDVTFSLEKGVTAGSSSLFTIPPTGKELVFGDYSPNRFAWRLENIVRLPQPVPAKGALSLWEWDVPAETQEWLNMKGTRR